ncbi:MAG: hypothetical protein ACFFC3_10510 [Candidatus Odinarchaeota archaeon]
MEIVESKKGILSSLALIFGILLIIVAIIEFSLILLESLNEEFSLLFFTTPGDAVFESAFLDHIMKGFVNLVIGAIFLVGFSKIRKLSPEGYSFLIGGGILILGIGFLFIMIWIANLIDTAFIGISEPEVWLEYIITDGIRIEWFLGIGAISILSFWKKRELYIK